MEQINLILTRHGETLENRKHMMQGHIPGTLSPLGIEQAEQLAVLLKDEMIDCVVCSDLARSYDTAMIIAGPRGVEPVPVRLLREIDWGPHTGGRLDRLDWANLPEGCETLAHLFSRAACFIDYLKENYAGKVVLVVGHGAINRAIVACLQGLVAEDMIQMPIMKNTACERFIL